MEKILNKQNRALLGELVRTDFKLRYQGSMLGYAWSLLKPLMLFAILYVVFAKFLRIGGDIPHYPIYLLLGIVTWNFFSEMTNQSLASIVARGDLIRKIKIPRWIIVMSASVSALISLGLNLAIVAVFLVANQVDITKDIILLPLFILEIYFFALGISFLLSALFVKFRDISNIWEVVMQAGFYATPVIYPLSMIANETYQKLILMNPMAQAIQDARFVTVTHDTVVMHSLHNGQWYVLIPVAVVLVVFVAGVSFFRRESKFFAENL